MSNLVRMSPLKTIRRMKYCLKWSGSMTNLLEGSILRAWSRRTSQLIYLMISRFKRHCKGIKFHSEASKMRWWISKERLSPIETSWKSRLKRLKDSKRCWRVLLLQVWLSKASKKCWWVFSKQLTVGKVIHLSRLRQQEIPRIRKPFSLVVMRIRIPCFSQRLIICRVTHYRVSRLRLSERI